MSDTIITTPLTAVELAEAASESIRSLNHATFMVSSPLSIGGDLYPITADLANLGFRLHQACEQLSKIAGARLAAGGLVADDGTDPAGAIAAAQHELELAAGLAWRFGNACSAAQSTIARIADPL